MFSLYNRRNVVALKGGWTEDDDHDRFNRRCPSKNYDKFPKKIRPRKPQGCELEEDDPALVPLTSASRSLSLNSTAVGCLGTNRRASDVSLPFLGPSSPSAIAATCTAAVVTPSAARSPSPVERRGSTVSRELDSLANWFHRLRWNSVREGVGRRNSQANGNRHYSRYDYTALEDNQSVHEKLEMERKVLRSQARETAFLTCQYYLKSIGRYVLLEQLGDIGSRQDKFWFLVRDTNLKTDRLLTMVPQTVNSPVHFSVVSKKTLSELFLALQHPYIYPVLDVDVKTLSDDEFVMVILPYNAKGSLKDIIHKVRCQADWNEKYRHQSNGLPLSQVQRLGRQILEALLFLQDRGFTPFGHLHCGNVIVQNGVSRLTGFENTLLGYASRCAPVIQKKLVNDYKAIDVICFGHVLFEMCAGYELTCAHPTARHLDEIEKQFPQVAQVLNFIFEQEDCKYPTIEEISSLDFFRNLDLREMRSMPVPPLFQTQLSPSIQNLLREVRLYQASKKWACAEEDAHPSTSSFRGASNDVDNEGSSDMDGEVETCFTRGDVSHGAGCCLFERNFSSECSKRMRPSGAHENDQRIGKTTTALIENKGGKLKKRRSNSTCSNAAPDPCKSDPQSRQTTPYASTLDITMSFVNSDVRTNHVTTADEFHTPPNSPQVSTKINLDDDLMDLLSPDGNSSATIDVKGINSVNCNDLNV